MTFEFSLKSRFLTNSISLNVPLSIPFFLYSVPQSHALHCWDSGCWLAHLWDLTLAKLSSLLAFLISGSFFKRKLHKKITKRVIKGFLVNSWVMVKKKPARKETLLGHWWFLTAFWLTVEALISDRKYRFWHCTYLLIYDLSTFWKNRSVGMERIFPKAWAHFSD